VFISWKKLGDLQAAVRVRRDYFVRPDGEYFHPGSRYKIFMDLRDYAPDSLAFEMKMHLFGLGWHGGSVKGGRVLIFRLINALQKDFPVREGHRSYQMARGTRGPQRERGNGGSKSVYLSPAPEEGAGYFATTSLIRKGPTKFDETAL
jgi:hypothetical protein